ncbi:hypothetical protein MS2017_1545 [Bathymodiolus thermophilus thioautotrophic gill symbiont]|uniref:GmrSD restriction endonucleases N-terminal domain-containing protein n=1 Tax=Bathymodiolus thermophilus thioautotrophic gill symbiont TaxID=2360 RepID=A0A3G3INF7_9GAMM|nr:DUF262 domain-containing protein [Bathymodiolus thermophilus thioautotrophic gill symbiont]AYQ57229.1 hypothetical protein MS2017_1545 [Bathymodiolus thermophilus thioautotrophic gill symbiont]
MEKIEQINWQPSTNSILDLRDWTDNNRLDIAPDFQRKFVWGNAAQIMLMDTILKNIPMPKIFVSNVVKDNSPYRSVIDGQQRITAILSFIRNEFSLKKPYNGEFFNKKFSQLPENIQNTFLRYKLDFNEINDASDEQLREIYSRVNKYSTVLNKQELRRSDFPGDFLELAEKLAVNSFFDNTKIFTITSRRRFGDAEYVSELLAGLIDGTQDKKNALDDFYRNYADWDTKEKDKIEKEFVETLKDIHLIFNEKECIRQSGPITAIYHEELKFKGFIGKTRFKQKADFYALFFAINQLKRNGLSIVNKNLDNLRIDLALMDKYINPNSEINRFREYATKCLSDANSKASREWRIKFLSSILLGTYGAKENNQKTCKIFSEIAFSWIKIKPSSQGEYGCPTSLYCGKCNTGNFYQEDDENSQVIANDLDLLYWDDSELNHQLVNSRFICPKCFYANVKKV